LEPFLKWAGGKRWFITHYSSLLPNSYNRYIEPFLGSGSVFFHLEPSKSVLSDKNSELIMTYTAIKNNPEEVYKILKKHASKHNTEYYYIVRNQKPRIGVYIAARMIYLNRTCWNGLYRVNLHGKFNVPIGTKNKVIYENESFSDISKILKNAEIVCCDYQDIVDDAESGDFLFIDPPYTVKHNFNGFIKYNEELFSWEDQIRLAECAIKAKERGAKVIITNANHESVTSLYKNGFSLKVITRSSIISGNPKYRKKCEEAVLCSY
jgi:DNA adenine methylase